MANLAALNRKLNALENKATFISEKAMRFRNLNERDMLLRALSEVRAEIDQTHKEIDNARIASIPKAAEESIEIVEDAELEISIKENEMGGEE